MTVEVSAKESDRLEFLKMPPADKVELIDEGWPGYYLTRDWRVYSVKQEKFYKVRQPKLTTTIPGSEKGSRVEITTKRSHGKYFGVAEFNHVPKKDKYDLALIGFEGYILTRDGRVWSNCNHRWLSCQISDTGKKYVTINNKVMRNKKIFLEKAVNKYFNLRTLDSEPRIPLDIIGFSNYEISISKRIYSKVKDEFFIERHDKQHCKMLRDDGKTMHMSVWRIFNLLSEAMSKLNTTE